MKNQDLIDLFKKEKGLKSAKEVAIVFKQTPSLVSGWGAERRPIPIEIKLRMLEHIKYTDGIQGVAACFVDIDKFRAEMQEDLDRIDELKNKAHQKYSNQREIDRLATLQHTQNLTDDQLAAMLGTTADVIANVKAGDAILETKSKASLFLILNPQTNSPAPTA